MTQTILIVGASRGLGLGLVAEHLSRGFDVIATVRKAEDEPGLRALDGSDRLTILHADVTSDADIARLATEIPNPVDIVFINAGVAGPRSLIEASADELNTAMQANVFGPIRLAHALAGHVRETTGGLALMSSIMGSIAENTSGGMEVYRATKTAQNSLARSLWLSGPKDRGVAVLSVHPGWVKTDMGGENADIDVQTSVSGIADQVKAHAGSNGHVFVDYSGREIAW